MLSRDPRKRAGISRVEVVVVILMLLGLVAVLIPRGGNARDAARRIECSNNLRDIGFAMQNFESTQGNFPTERSAPSQPLSGLSFYTQLLDNLELSNLKDEQGQPLPSGQAKVFLCPSRRTPGQAPGARDLGYLKSNGEITAALDNPKVSVGLIANATGTASTVLLAHVWVPPASYVQEPANPSWAALYPAHAMTNSSRIFPDKDPAGANALGSPHSNMPAVFADNHIGHFPLKYPHLAAVFSIAPSREPATNIP
jgi:type II secretory pathway pseudopilin PulG